MRTYEQYCPIARAAEVFAERWTPLIVRNIHAGSSTYVYTGVPQPLGPSHVSAQVAAWAPNSGPQYVPLPPPCFMSFSLVGEGAAI